MGQENNSDNPADVSRRRFISSALVGGTALAIGSTAFGRSSAFALTKTSSVTTKPLKIGAIVDTSGALGVYGQAMINGFKTYLDQHGGKLGGRPVTVMVANTAGSASVALQDSSRLLADGIEFAYGGVTDEEAQAFIPVFNDRKQPVVLTGPNADIFSTTDKTPYAWRTGCTFNQDGHDPAKWFVEKHGPGTYYFICWKFSSTPGLAAAVAAGVAAGGAKLAPTIFTPFPVTGNFEPYLTQVKNGKAKGLITFVGGSDAASLLQQFDSFGLNGKIPLMGVGAACEPNTIPAVANYVNGTYGCEFYIPGLKNAANSAFKSVYSASYKSSPNYYAVAAYDAASYIDKVLTRTKGDTSDKSRLEDALSQPYVLDSPRGSTTMNTKYQCLTTPMYVWQNHGSGKSVKQTVVNTSFPAPET